MKLLLDTQIVIWMLLDDARYTSRLDALIEDPINQVHISPVNHWERAIKVARGKIKIDRPFEELWTPVEARFATLPITARHSARTIDLPAIPNHKDPFDRLLVAQSLVEDIPLVSADAQLDAYGVRRIH